jgi:hypothetical protein
MACVSLRFSKEFAKASKPPRPRKAEKSVSETLPSLFDQTSPDLVYSKKTAYLQIFMILAALPSS